MAEIQTTEQTHLLLVVDNQPNLNESKEVSEQKILIKSAENIIEKLPKFIKRYENWLDNSDEETSTITKKAIRKLLSFDQRFQELPNLIFLLTQNNTSDEIDSLISQLKEIQTELKILRERVCPVRLFPKSLCKWIFEVIERF